MPEPQKIFGSGAGLTLASFPVHSRSMWARTELGTALLWIRGTRVVIDPMTRPSSSPVFESEDLVAAVWENVLITVWRRQVTTEALDRCGEILDELRWQFPEGIGALTIMRRGVRLSVAAAVRQRSQEILARGDGFIRARAFVLDGDGFWASTLRSLLIGIGYARRSDAKVVATPREGAVHLAERLGGESGWADALGVVAERIAALPEGSANQSPFL